jgi:hypothetical protein
MEEARLANAGTLKSAKERTVQRERLQTAMENTLKHKNHEEISSLINK